MNWLLLRGLAREQRHWGRFTGIFSEDVAPDRVFCLDLPGTGTEANRESPWSAEAIAGDVRERWLALRSGTPGEWGLVAISLGGMIGMLWSGSHPEDFQRLVLINSSAANVALPHERLRPLALARIVSTLAMRDLRKRELAILALTTRLQESPATVAAEWVRVAAEVPMKAGTAIRQIAAASRFLAPRKLEVPTLVVSALRDEFTDPACSRRLAERFDAELVCHPRAGHDLPLDDPHWLSVTIRDWSRHCTDRVR